MVRKKNRRSNRKKGGMMTAATRFKKFNNPKSNQIKSLFNTILNGKGPLSMEMKTFIATPWCQCGVDNRWQACSSRRNWTCFYSVSGLGNAFTTFTTLGSTIFCHVIYIGFVLLYIQ